jgi:hypothetical protein
MAGSRHGVSLFAASLLGSHKICKPNLFGVKSCTSTQSIATWCRLCCDRHGLALLIRAYWHLGTVRKHTLRCVLPWLSLCIGPVLAARRCSGLHADDLDITSHVMMLVCCLQSPQLLPTSEVRIEYPPTNTSLPKGQTSVPAMLSFDGALLHLPMEATRNRRGVWYLRGATATLLQASCNH